MEGIITINPSAYTVTSLSVEELAKLNNTNDGITAAIITLAQEIVKLKEGK